MGVVSKPLNLHSIIHDYNIKNFVETGTGLGVSLNFMLKLFPQLDMYSIELLEDLFNKARKRFPTVHLYNGDTRDILPKIINNITGNTLFWLDAHSPEKYTTMGKEQRMPLEIELSYIKNYPYKSVIIIDDLRMYEDGPYKKGNWKDRAVYGENSIQFIYDNFPNHDVRKWYEDEGYITLTPNE